MAVKIFFNILGEFHYHIKKNGNFQKKELHSPQSQHIKFFASITQTTVNIICGEKTIQQNHNLNNV